MIQFPAFLSLLTNIGTHKQDGVYRTAAYDDFSVLLKISCDYTRYVSNFSIFTLRLTNVALKCGDKIEQRDKSLFNGFFIAYAHSYCWSAKEESQILQFYGMLKGDFSTYRFLNPVCNIASRKSSFNFEPTYEYSLVPLDFGTRALVKWFTSQYVMGNFPQTTMGLRECCIKGGIGNDEFLTKEYNVSCSSKGIPYSPLSLWSRDDGPTCQDMMSCIDTTSTHTVLFWPSSVAIDTTQHECIWDPNKTAKEINASLAANASFIANANFTSNESLAENASFTPVYSFTNDVFTSYLQSLVASENQFYYRYLEGQKISTDSLVYNAHYLQVSCSCRCGYGLPLSNVVSVSIRDQFTTFTGTPITECADSKDEGKRAYISINRHLGKPCYFGSTRRDDGDMVVTTFHMETSLFHYLFATANTLGCEIRKSRDQGRVCYCLDPHIKSRTSIEQRVPRILKGYTGYYYQCYVTPTDKGTTRLRIIFDPAPNQVEERSSEFCLIPGAACISLLEVMFKGWDRSPPKQIVCDASVFRQPARSMVVSLSSFRNPDSPALKMEVKNNSEFVEVTCAMQASMYLHNLTIRVGLGSIVHAPLLLISTPYSLRVTIDELLSQEQVICSCLLQSFNGFIIHTESRELSKTVLVQTKTTVSYVEPAAAAGAVAVCCLISGIVYCIRKKTQRDVTPTEDADNLSYGSQYLSYSGTKSDSSPEKSLPAVSEN